MAVKVTPNQNEGSDGGLRLTLLDSDGVAVDPAAIASIAYSLSDAYGTKSVTEQPLTVANPVTIPRQVSLPADTTAVAVVYLVTVTWTYTDANLGAGTVHVEEFAWPVNNIINKVAT